MQTVAIAATTAAVLLVPGGCLVAAVGPRRVVPSAWLLAPISAVLSLVLLTAALIVTFVVGGALVDTVLGLAVVSVLLLLRAGNRRRADRRERRRRRLPAPEPWRFTRARVATLVAVAAGVVVGWIVQGALFSDTLYHVGQAVKLAELERIGLNNTLQFKDGSAHPGYFIPTFQALIAVPSMVWEAARVALVLPIVTVPLGVLAAAGLGHVVGGNERSAAVASWAWVAVPLLGAAPSFRASSLATYGGVFVLQVVIPVVVALVVAAIRDDEESARGFAITAGFATMLVGILHVSYLSHLGLAMLAIVLGWTWSRPDPTYGARRVAAVLAVVLVASVIVAGALAPRLLELQTFLQDTGNVQMPGEGEIERAHAEEMESLLVGGDARFRLRADVVVGAGGVVFVALLAALVGGIAHRRRPLGWLPLGTAALVLSFALWKPAFTYLSAAMGIDQARRVAEALMLVLAIVAASELWHGVVARSWPRARGALVAGSVAVSAGIVALVVLVPRMAELGGEQVMDEWPVQLLAIVFVVVVLALLVGAARRVLQARRGRSTIDLMPPPTQPPLASRAAVLVFLLPVLALVGSSVGMAVDGLSTRLDMHRLGLQRGELSWIGPKERAALEEIPAGSIVLADVRRRTSFRIMAIAPVYVVGAPVGHVANTERNAIGRRAQRVNRLLEGTIAPDQRRRFLDGFGVEYVVLRDVPRYADDVEAMRGPLADDWREVADTGAMVVFARR